MTVSHLKIVVNNMLRNNEWLDDIDKRCTIGSDIFGNSMEVHILSNGLVDLAVYSENRDRVAGLKIKKEYAMKMANYIVARFAKEEQK